MESFRELTLSLDSGIRFAIVLVASVVIAEAAQRLLRLPRIAGYVLGGVLFGPSVLAMTSLAEVKPWNFLVEMILGLLAFELGSRAEIAWLRNNPWLLAASIGEALATFMAVVLLLLAWGFADTAVLAIAAICMATSPSVVARTVNDLRARGQVTGRALLMVALNVIYSIVCFEAVLVIARLEEATPLPHVLLSSAYFLWGSLLLAGVVAWLVRFIFKTFSLRDNNAFVLALAVIFLAGAVAHQLHLSVPLTLLLGGLLLRHYSISLVLFPPHFGTAGEVLVMIMFVLTGSQLDVSTLYAAGLIALSLLAVRTAVKMTTVSLLARPAGLGARKGLLLGAALTPMSTLALLMMADPRLAALGLSAHMRDIMAATLLLMQLLGPVICTLALLAAREERMDITESFHA